MAYLQFYWRAVRLHSIGTLVARNVADAKRSLAEERSGGIWILFIPPETRQIQDGVTPARRRSAPPMAAANSSTRGDSPVAGAMGEQYYNPQGGAELFAYDKRSYFRRNPCVRGKQFFGANQYCFSRQEFTGA